MPESRRKFDQDFKEGAVRLVRKTGRPIAQIAKDLGINAPWVTGWPRIVEAGTALGGWRRTSAWSWPGCGGERRAGHGA
jgi:transposase